jgi:uncharacterized protein (DUF1778 family)
MSMRRTPPLSIEGSREVIEEMSKPPADTPERRRMFERARALRPLVRRLGQPKKFAGGRDNGAAVSMGIPRLSREGTRELIREMESPPADTPQRRAMFRRAEAMHRFVDRLLHPGEPVEKA